MKAFAWAGGQIEFGRKVPFGAIQVLCGPAAAAREIICATARHGYDGKTLLVPGVPEADNQADAMTALLAWRDQIQSRMDRRLNSQVQS